MNNILNYTPLEASLETLKVRIKDDNKSKQELDKVFLNYFKIAEAEATKSGVLMIYSPGYPKETYLKAIELTYKASGIILMKVNQKDIQTL